MSMSYIFLNAVRTQRGAQLYIDRQIGAGMSIFAVREQCLNIAEHSRVEANVKGARLVLQEIKRVNSPHPIKNAMYVLGLIAGGLLIILFFYMLFPR